MAAYLLANQLTAPAQFAQHVRQAVTMNDLGSRYNAGLLAFIKDVSGGGGRGPLAADRTLAICLACALALLALFALPVRTPFALPVWAPFAAGTPGALPKDY